uniref:Uncharacterized protein n=1 Tax=Anguilla anguilla TaxID=7936 RepID=A0A0E9TES3_ANGAN
MELLISRAALFSGVLRFFCVPLKEVERVHVVIQLSIAAVHAAFSWKPPMPIEPP